MTTVRETVQNLVACYPMLFSSLDDCYEQMFFTHGGGFSWYKGELVAEFNDGVPYQDYKENPESILEVRMNQRLEQVRDHFDLFMDDHVTFSDRDLKVCVTDNSAFNPPDDITDDWREALDQVLSGFNVWVNTTHRLNDEERDIWRDHINNVKEKLFPGRTARLQELFAEILEDNPNWPEPKDEDTQ